MLQQFPLPPFTTPEPDSICNPTSPPPSLGELSNEATTSTQATQNTRTGNSIKQKMIPLLDQYALLILTLILAYRHHYHHAHLDHDSILPRFPTSPTSTPSPSTRTGTLLLLFHLEQ